MLFRAVTDGDPTVCTTLLAPAAAAQLVTAADASDRHGTSAFGSDGRQTRAATRRPSFDAVTKLGSRTGSRASPTCRLR
jgi:hypothetical protein